MAIEIIPGADAWRRSADNPLGTYPEPGKDGERLYPLANPQTRPSFAFSRDSRIFTLGSCFARSIESALSGNGFDVRSKNFELPADVIGEIRSERFFNKYIVHSIGNELRWALDPATPFPGIDALCQDAEGRYLDCHLDGGQIFRGTAEEILKVRRAYLDFIRRVADCDVVVITLGLVEAWFDCKNGIYLNREVPLDACEREPGRFEMRVLDHGEVLAELEAIHAVLAAFARVPQHILLTVSPVPLQQTFRDHDILLANCYSKSVQRAAAEAFAARHANVDYFPSYEFVVLSNPDQVWNGRDYRHVANAVVRRIMEAVFDEYLKDDPLHHAAMFEKRIKKLYRDDDLQGVVEAFGERGDGFPPTADTLHLVGLSQRKLGAHEASLAAFQAALDADPGHRRALEAAIVAARVLRRPDLLAALLAEHAGRHPGEEAFRARYRVQAR